MQMTLLEQTEMKLTEERILQILNELLSADEIARIAAAGCPHFLCLQPARKSHRAMRTAHDIQNSRQLIDALGKALKENARARKRSR